MDGLLIKNLVESEGKRRATQRLKSLLHDGHLEPKDFSLRVCWEALVGPVGKTLTYGSKTSGVVEVAEAAVDSSAFADITGHVLMDRAMEEYDRPGYIGGDLFENVPSNRRSERIPGFTLQDETATVEQGQPYPRAGMDDRYVRVESGKKRGLILEITEEAIFLDETGQLLRSARNIGRFIRLNKENRQLDVFTGQTNNYQPGGTSTTIYSSDNGNLISDNELVDWTSVDTALQTLGAQKDENGELIMAQPNMLVVPWAYRMAALRVLGATETRKNTGSSNQNTTVSPNPVEGTQEGVPDLKTSPRLDQYDDGDEWYLGEPRRGYIYREHWPFQSFRKRQQSQKAFENDIVEQLKFREWGTPHCVDHRFVVKNAVT